MVVKMKRNQYFTISKLSNTYTLCTHKTGNFTHFGR